MSLKRIFSYLAMTILLAHTTIAFCSDTEQPSQGAHTPKNIILIGPPASGKGTQARFISETYKIPPISTGDLLRNEALFDTDRGRLIKEMMAQGKLVSDDIVIELVKERLSQEDAQRGFILDGFPRTVAQAQKLEAMGGHIHHVLVLEVPDEVIVHRISGRRIHPGSGRTYHVDDNPPKVEGLDDETGEPLIQREDDTEEAVTKRIELYREQTMPVIDWYKTKAKDKNNHLHLFVIDATQSIENIQDSIKTLLEQ